MLKLLSCFLMLSSAYAGSALDIIQEKALNLKEMRKVEQDLQGFGSQKAICNGINRLLDGTNSRISEINHADSDERIKTLGVLLQNIIVSGKKKLRTFKKSKHDHKNAHRAALSLMEWGMYNIYKNPILGADRQDFMDNILNRQDKIEKHLGSDTRSYVLKYLNKSTLEILFPLGYFHHAASYALGFKDYENKVGDVIAALALEGGTPLTRPEFNLQDDLKEVAFSHQKMSNGVFQIKINCLMADDTVQEESMGYILDQRQNTEIGRVFYAEETLGEPKRYLPIDPIDREKIIANLMENYALDDSLEFEFKAVAFEEEGNNNSWDEAIPAKLNQSNKGRTLRQILPDLFAFRVNIYRLLDFLNDIKAPTQDALFLREGLWLSWDGDSGEDSGPLEKIKNLLEHPDSIKELKIAELKRQFGMEKIQQDDLDLFEFNRDNYILPSFKQYVDDITADRIKTANKQVIEDFKTGKIQLSFFPLIDSFQTSFKRWLHVLKNPLYRDPIFLNRACKEMYLCQDLLEKLRVELDKDDSAEDYDDHEFKKWEKTTLDFGDEKTLDFIENFIDLSDFDYEDINVYNYINYEKLDHYFFTLDLAVKRNINFLPPSQKDIGNPALTEADLDRKNFPGDLFLEKGTNILDLLGKHNCDPIKIGLQLSIAKQLLKASLGADHLSEEDQDKIIASFPLFNQKPYLLNKDGYFKNNYFNF